jgi:hypothetical protein
VDYDLTRLGDREFEHLTQAVALQVLGAGVSVFGDGPDGGREATFEGRTRFPEPGEHWDGYGVVQAKFKRRPVGGGRDVTDLLRAIQAELTASRALICRAWASSRRSTAAGCRLRWGRARG